VNVAEFAENALDCGRIAVCVGCGGVGKTTVAAAIALEAARRHRKVAVLTIDPARRLADSLGVR
jgi:anion-transporting  ArsA/GET3 family ATPase